MYNVEQTSISIIKVWDVMDLGTSECADSLDVSAGCCRQLGAGGRGEDPVRRGGRGRAGRARPRHHLPGQDLRRERAGPQQGGQGRAGITRSCNIYIQCSDVDYIFLIFVDIRLYKIVLVKKIFKRKTVG